MHAATKPVTEEQVSTFQRDGVVVLRAILTDADVATLERGIERNLADLSPLGLNAAKPGEPGAFVEDFRNWQRIPEYAQAVRASCLPAAAGALMRSRAVRLFHDHLLVKEAGTLDRSPWHQEQGAGSEHAVELLPVARLIQSRV